jgi:hypothetical protein
VSTLAGAKALEKQGRFFKVNVAVPEVGDLDKIIEETKRSYRQPQKDDTGKYTRYSISPENLILVHKTNYL